MRKNILDFLEIKNQDVLDISDIAPCYGNKNRDSDIAPCYGNKNRDIFGFWKKGSLFKKTGIGTFWIFEKGLAAKKNGTGTFCILKKGLAAKKNGPELAARSS